MEINVQLTPSIINQSLQLHYKHASFIMRNNIFLVPIVLIGISCFLIFKETQKPQFGQNGWLGIVYIALAIAYFFYTNYRRTHTGKQLIKAMGNRAAFTITATNEELITLVTNTTITTPWADFVRAIITQNLVLLYQPNRSFTMFHFSFFKEKEFDTFKALVDDKIKSK